MPNTKQTIIDAVTMMRLDVLARIDNFCNRMQPLIKSAEQLVGAELQNSRVDELDQSIGAVRELVDALRKDHDTILRSIGGQINLLEGRIAQLETARENHDERISSHHKRLGGMQKWIKDTNEQLDDIKDRQDRLFRHHLDHELLINLLRKDICEKRATDQ